VLLIVGALLGVAAHALDTSKEFHNFVSNTWSIEEGLPQISALAMSQDSQGYLWVGTQAGLARFDGHRFTAYTPENAPGLPGTYINALLTDDAGNLWVGTYKGLARWRTDRFVAVPVAADANTAPNILALARTAQGVVLAAAGSTVHAVENDLLYPYVQLERPARALLVEGPDLWIGSVGGVYLRQPDAALRFIVFPADARNTATRALLRANGSLWAGTSEGLFVLIDGRWQRYAGTAGLSHTPIEAMLLDRDGNHWIAELAHLTRLRSDGSFERVVREGSGLSIRSLFEDREANLWLGSQWSGVTRLRNGWTRRYSERQGLKTPLLWSVAEADGGALWVGSDAGLVRFENGRFTQVIEGGALPHPSAYSLRAEGDRLWIGTRYGLAVLEDGALSTPARFEPLAALQINGIVRDAGDRLWLATSSGAFRDDGERVIRIGEAEGMSDPRVRFLLPTQDGRLLMGTQAGLYEIRDDRALPFAADLGMPPALDITVLHELANGDLVAGSLSELLYVFSAGRWHLLGKAQGMPGNAPFFLAHDENYLWVAGIRGIGRVPLSDLQALVDGRSSRVRGEMLLNERGDRRGGQKGFCCNGAGNSKGLQRGRTLWAPSRDGLVALDTQDARMPDAPPTTLIERVRIDNEWRPLQPGQLMSLPVDARDLAFEFTAISFYEPRSIGFRYRLLGYHDDWREPDEAGQRVTGYTNLPGGNYRFEVQGSTAADQWSPPATLEFRIEPKFRETGWFVALLAAGVGLLGLAGYRLQRRRYRQSAMRLEALVQQRTLDLAEANQRLHEATQTDPLTGLRNRRYLAAQIPKDIAFYARELSAPTPHPRVLLFALADIDHFKSINDTYGHAVGDRVLQQFAEVLLGQVRTGDYVARWGGEEFVLVFRPMPLAFLPVLGERLRSAIAAYPFDIGAAKPLRLTCSLGLCQYPLLQGGDDSLHWEHLLELADSALYRVKRGGRNGWGAYQAKAGVNAGRVLALLRESESALEQSSELNFIGGGATEAARGILELPV
jgi:diguanylate cyclase (GGDEF)-like protein